jgi:hypothetical protein
MGSRKFEMRLKDETRERWEKAAAKEGLPLTEFVRRTVDEKTSGPVPKSASGKKSYNPDPRVKR